MERLNVTQARQQFSKIITSGEIYEVQHPKHSVVIIPKDKYEMMEKEILLKEIEEAMEQSETRFTSDEVNAMLMKVRKDKKHHG